MSVCGSQLEFPGPTSSLFEAYRRLRKLLEAAGVAQAALDARLLVMDAVGIDHVTFVRDGELALGDGHVRLKQAGLRRLDREPVSRILGRRQFWGLEFEIGPAVLDPRPESELVVSAALELVADASLKTMSVLDLGVGSGALLGALLTELKGARGLGLDISRSACLIARRNLARLGLGGRAEIVHGDWTGWSGSRFDLILANPPYVASGDIGALEPEVARFDPHLALDGGEDGLDCYRAIAKAAPRMLRPDGYLVCEIGQSQARAIASIFSSSALRVIRSLRDLAGLDRVLVAEIVT